ncbi:putative Zn-dependent protease [Halospina denitrificans]|uniref:Putative beta-barrel assembly-enhancing protease n=2 Tax=Halospina denitrificans TaxID=332522 RepID=A0A4R7JWZ1_9GAMM|nr:putative Zn-dependent protease [Halospina denitrificans]
MLMIARKGPSTGIREGHDAIYTTGPESGIVSGMHRLISIVLILTLLNPLLMPLAVSDELPTLGGSGLLAEQQEEEIGQRVLVQLRRNAPLLSDPVLTEYLENTLYQIIPHAPMEDRSISIVAIDDPSLNAFAVPGNVVGVHAGLFLSAQSEHEFAAVMAHEIAHLSQRHYARRLEQQERSTPLTIAGILAGIILTAATGSQAGIATIAGTQALAIDTMLRHSRAHEQEADRLGLELLAEAGYDPAGMPAMFERMLRQARLQGNRPPEYLSTHPLTESRVSDTRARVKDYRDQESYGEDLAYHLVRNRLRVRYTNDLGNAEGLFRQQFEKSEGQARAAARYGLAYTLIEAGRPDEAIPHLEALLADNEGYIIYAAELGRALRESGDHRKAITLLEKHLERNPGNLTLSRTLADTHMEANDPDRAARLYERIAQEYGDDPTLWKDLAEAHGRAGNVIEVHRARGERSLLLGDPRVAVREFRQALDRAGSSHTRIEVLRERLEEANRRLSRLGDRRPRAGNG